MADQVRHDVLQLRFLPATSFFNEVHQFLDGVLFGDILLHSRLALEQGNAAGATAHVAEVGVRHLARAVHDAAHDADGNVGEVAKASLDLAHDLLDVVQGTSAARAADKVRLAAAAVGGLQNVECKEHAFLRALVAVDNTVGTTELDELFVGTTELDELFFSELLDLSFDDFFSASGP